MGIDNNITILSMNVRGLFSNKKKRLDVFDWAQGKHASIICFQETHSSKDVEKIWEEEWGNTCIFCHHNNRSAGVSIMFKKGLDFTIHDTKFDQNGRYIVIDITLFEQRLTLVCLYGYNTDEPLLFDDILYKIALYANTSILLCGDWNVVQDCNLDTYNILHKRNPKSREKIEEIIEKLELLDPWRTCHPTDKKFTWRQPSPIKQSRLDYFLVTEDIYSLMKNTKIIPGYKTDHSAIVFTFSASLAKRGKGYWKFNSQLLRDVEYVEKIKTCIKDTISEYYLSGDIQNCFDVKLTCNDQLFFEIMKMKIRTLSISYSIEKNREDREHTSKLEKEVEQLENIMSMSMKSVNVQATLHGKKLELENKREQKIEGLLLRSRANWHENGEKCSQYFCKLEKSNFIKKTMAELIDDQDIYVEPSYLLAFNLHVFIPRAANEFKALESDHENLKKKLDAAKSRNSVLSKEIKSFKQQMQTMVQKGQHDDELIEALMLQQAQLQKMLEQTSETKTLTEVDSREKVKQMEMKKQHDNNIVQQLKIIVAEKETKVHALEDEIKQLKLNHLQKAQMENANMIFQPSNRPQSTNENVELEFRLSSVTPTDSRLSDRPPTVNSMLESARSQSRKSLVREPSFTVNNLDKRAVNELTYQCQEYKTLMQVADVEREKLSELVQVLQKRSDESTQKVADVQNELINQRKKNALLEKQIGKSKIEQSSKCKGDGLPSRSKKQPGRASSVNVASSIRDSAVFGEMDEDDLPQNMNLEELVTTLEIQKDEIDSLKGTLKNTLKAKEEDLRMYSQMMEETKTVFLQALKQFKENDQGT
ncbi:unnamed protein product [Mytilus coruscus]|uniref:Endonuclease/exonuclease/phosphatase domain-containing protein n=1 Tax=Mytilus coruscus TaxID=42192 RepID=A0A6J8DVN5_MYTCO|nr:unnamed protein product [Mytilus coruscus]